MRYIQRILKMELAKFTETLTFATLYLFYPNNIHFILIISRFSICHRCLWQGNVNVCSLEYVNNYINLGTYYVVSCTKRAKETHKKRSCMNWIYIYILFWVLWVICKRLCHHPISAHFLYGRRYRTAGPAHTTYILYIYLFNAGMIPYTSYNK